jgi:hypothetical protein
MGAVCGNSLPVYAFHQAADTICLRGDADRAGSGSGLLVEDEEHSEHDREKALRCRACNFAITAPKERFTQDGKHHHTFFNPAGIVYEIGCFKDAPGCLPYGSLSREFTWFKGYSWQVVYCKECLEHLGWYYATAGNGFFGLVLNRLRER